MDSGAAGVMIAPAPGLRTEEQVGAYFATVFAELGPDIPVCLQDYPQSTGVYLSVPALYRLVDAFPQLVMFKHEDCPGLPKLSRIRQDVGGHRRLSILVGNGGLYYPQELRRGADGAMTGFAFPEMLVRVYELFQSGDADAAEDLFDLYLPLVRHEQQPGFGLAVRKEILRRRGVIRSAAVRRPGPALSSDDHAELDHLLARLSSRLAAGAPGLSRTMSL
jgi:4-hydroxy-tetrahydrodipicolinate synthase